MCGLVTANEQDSSRCCPRVLFRRRQFYSKRLLLRAFASESARQLMSFSRQSHMISQDTCAGVCIDSTRNELASLAHSFYTSISSCINYTLQLYKPWMMLHSRLYKRLILFFANFGKIHNNIIASCVARPARLHVRARAHPG